jgi:hypothetical protein
MSFHIGPNHKQHIKNCYIFCAASMCIKGIQGLLKDYNNGGNRFVIEQMQEFKGKELHSLWNEEREYIIQTTPDIEDSLLKNVIDIKSMKKPELLYGPDKSHINKLAYYMTITGAKKGQLLYILDK